MNGSLQHTDSWSHHSDIYIIMLNGKSVTCVIVLQNNRMINWKGVKLRDSLPAFRHPPFSILMGKSIFSVSLQRTDSWSHIYIIMLQRILLRAPKPSQQLRFHHPSPFDPQTTKGWKAAVKVSFCMMLGGMRRMVLFTGGYILNENISGPSKWKYTFTYSSFSDISNLCCKNVKRLGGNTSNN